MAIPPAKHILIAPLDWGSGHTTRCIPLIRHMVQAGHRVTAAGNATQQTLLRKNIPELNIVPLEGYNVRYSNSAFLPNLMRQVPRLMRTVRSEHRWLMRYCKETAVDGIISDNRYGLHHPHIPSVIITHQLSVRTGLGSLADALTRRLHYRFLERFGQCWVPDMEGDGGLAGSLSHPPHLPQHTHYIGLLSQLRPAKAVSETHVLILLSGPEPQRSILSDQLWEQALQIGQPVVFVEGRADVQRSNIPAHIHWLPVAGADAVQQFMEQASLVICRSGYSTLMDLVLLGKKAVLIPTPGQTEQEYLAAHLQRQGAFLSRKQRSFNLDDAIRAAGDFTFQPLASTGMHDRFKAALDAWITSL